MFKPAILALQDGTIFTGRSIGADGLSAGEVVFNTAMTGYQEILTDPSYCQQLITLTYPHIGNTGVNDEDEEATRIHASGLIIRDLPLLASNWRSQGNLQDYLLDRGVVAIADIDTRRLTRLLRDRGAQAGAIMAGDEVSEAVATEAARGFAGLAGCDLAQVVSTGESYTWNQTTWSIASGYGKNTEPRCHVVAYDYGIKKNILCMLADRGARVTVVPARTPADEVLAMNPDGIFLSNGPGDPEPCDYAIEAIARILDTEIPVFGICLGHQLLALASGASTIKMKFGHHGANHPVQDLDSGVVMITSQNHGFAVDEDSLPECLRATHRSLFDGSLQAVERTDKPAFSFQGHPEASPGPHDVAPMFDRFIDLIASYQASQGVA
ncbi:MAG: glutamine-hydrolyzing carbamoyl-phosphate synthase small subunit [Gammaproteobacteria bacterium]|nr:glutamine-hydrolyzing carbamoyl-phosphate synthase small subunit [Gammaproteobacteria bacterium]MDH3535938.1 glutamine-hydrolyzing carbamoyl-phosphate synthase small subunit [Gammaproteobacteria bacterium]